MDELDELYLEILNPVELINYFKTDEEFRSWCETGEVLDLSDTLIVFENHELYEHCVIIKEVLDEKIDDIDLTIVL